VSPKFIAVMACAQCNNDGVIAEAFMQTAAASALAGVRIGHGGPFGASIVRDGVVIACAHNMVLHHRDPTRHAEMNAIKQACESIGSHDLSDCELFTTCEPCPMCWGAVQWSRVGKVYLGVDRDTAAKYGFDDKVFYDEVGEKAGVYGLCRYGYIIDTSEKNDGKVKTEPKRVHKNMVEIYDGVFEEGTVSLFTNPLVNRTFRRRFASGGGEKLSEAFKELFDGSPGEVRRPMLPPPELMDQHESFMKLAIAAAEKGARSGKSKEREPFGAVIVKDGKVIAEAHNTVLHSRDATATAEVNVIREAAVVLGTHNLEGCDLYTTSHPDLMSLGAVLWARISHVYCGVTQQLAAQCGFEDGLLQFKDLLESEGSGGRSSGNIDVIEGISKDACEAVFKEWSDRNGVIY